MNADDIARYLRTHPQFFDQHPELLEAIAVPHPYGGRAIPLAERQTVALREKLKLLEGRLAELLQFGEENDAISEKVHRLSVALAGAQRLSGARSLALLPPARGLRRAARGAARLGQERAGGFRRGAAGGRGAAPPRRHHGRAAVRPGRRQPVRALVRRGRRARALGGAGAARPDHGRSACSRSAARTRSASTRRWARSIFAASASYAQPESQRGSDAGVSRCAEAPAQAFARRRFPTTAARSMFFSNLNGKKDLQSLEPAAGAALRRGAALEGPGAALARAALSAWRGCFRWLARHRGFQRQPRARHPRAESGAAAAEGALGRRRRSAFSTGERESSPPRRSGRGDVRAAVFVGIARRRARRARPERRAGAAAKSR